MTHCQMVPTMFSRLLRLPAEVARRYDLSSLECDRARRRSLPRSGQAGHDRLAGPHHHRVLRRHRGQRLHALRLRRVAGPSGHRRAEPSSASCSSSTTTGRSARPGVDGTVWFRGATNFEYFDDPAKTAANRSTDGEASTVGDVGHVDADGYLYLTDRKSYMIISGGVNIYPQETENLLSTHPAVLDVAVIGVPNEDLGEEVKAVVQPVDPTAAGPGAGPGADRLLPGPPGPLQVPAQRRFRRRAAPSAHRASCTSG